MNAMNFIKNIARFLVLLFLFGIPALGLELDFKLSGGYAYLYVHGIKRGIEGWAEWRKREAEGNENWLYLGQKISSLNSGIHLEGELMLSFTSRIGISLGTGYIYADLQEGEAEVLAQRPTGIFSQIYTITVSAYPLVLSGYYFIPLSSKLHFYVRGGGGLAWAKYVNREAKKFESAAKYNYFRLENASARGPIFVAGLGFVYETDVGVRFFLECLARTAKIQGFSGENQLEEKGALYYFEEYVPELDLWQARYEIRAESPSGQNFRSVSEAMVDFSGLSVKIGFIIRF
jgi:hypothetical protein